jgi:hypothetical protein
MEIMHFSKIIFYSLLIKAILFSVDFVYCYASQYILDSFCLLDN